MKVSVPLPPDQAVCIACRVVHSVLAFRHRSAVQGVPVVGGLSDPSDRRSPAEAMRSIGISFVALAVKELRGFRYWACVAGLGIKYVLMVH